MSEYIEVPRTMTVTLDYNEYLQLLIAQETLDTLESAGVDNWCNYGCNCDITDSDECIFCTEDEYKFVEKYAKKGNEE